MVYIATYLRESPKGWPFDHGDDPSFRSSERVHGRITWGVCRPNVRKMLHPGDGIVFFATDKLNVRCPARYQFVGFATVDRGVRYTDIWDDADLGVYRQYGNLLIRPAHSGFVHFEPELLSVDWHQDWLWRIADTEGFRKKDLCGPERFSISDRFGGRPVRIASNYILFRPEPHDTLVLANSIIQGNTLNANVSAGGELGGRGHLVEGNAFIGNLGIGLQVAGDDHVVRHNAILGNRCR